MNIGIFYFSATGITEKIANHIAVIVRKEGNKVKQKNIITPESRRNVIDFLEFDACIFGFPVFGGRPPIIAEEWMSTLEGKNLKCSMFFTYGARDLEWAHQVTYYLLRKANFKVVLSRLDARLLDLINNSASFSLVSFSKKTLVQTLVFLVTT